jgi:PAB1-binding protein PBP1
MATLPTFRTWVAGEIVTAAYMNTNVRDAGNFFLSWPVFEGRQTVAQSIPNSTSTAVLYDTEDIDTDNGHSTSVNTSQYKPVTAGRFQVSGKIGLNSGAGAQRGAQIFKNASGVNGGDTLVAPVSGASIRIPTPTMTMIANGSTDFFEIYIFQDSGGAINTIVSGTTQSTFSVRMVGTT